MNGEPEFLIHHGCAAALSRCRDEMGVRPGRGEAVVIRAARGLELGEVLCEAPGDVAIAAGQLLRRATREDRLRAESLSRRGQLLLDDLHRLIDEQQIPLLPLDVDLTLDGERADVHVLCWGPCPLTPLREQLLQQHGAVVYFLDRSKPAAKGCGSCGSGGCGEGGCGESGCGGGGCSTGGCSRGAASADELTHHFADLRAQMLAAGRVPLA